MATKLKNLNVTKVDFVDAGANQRADIKLFKRKEPDIGELESTSGSEIVTVPLAMPDFGLKRFLYAVGKKLGKYEFKNIYFLTMQNIRVKYEMCRGLYEPEQTDIAVLTS